MTRNALTEPKIYFFVRNLYGTKMQSFINLGRKKVSLNYDIKSAYKGHLRSKAKVPNESPVMTSYLKLIGTIYAYLVPFSRYRPF